MWSGQRDSNPRPSAPKADALPDCAMPRAYPLTLAKGRQSYQVGYCMQMPETLFGSTVAKQPHFTVLFDDRFGI
jgi:hypothetical protein